MSENSDYNKPISGKRLREAFAEANVVLGRAAHDAMFHDLETNAVAFRNRPYTLHELQNALKKIFGHDGTTLLMQRLQKALE